MKVACLCEAVLGSDIFQNVFAHGTQAESLASWSGGGVSYHFHSPLLFWEETLNNTMYRQNIVQLVLQTFQQQEGKMCYSSRIASVYTVPILLNMFKSSVVCKRIRSVSHWTYIGHNSRCLTRSVFKPITQEYVETYKWWGIMHRNMFSHHLHVRIFACTQECKPVLMPKENIQCIYIWYNTYFGTCLSCILWQCSRLIMLRIVLEFYHKRPLYLLTLFFHLEVVHIRFVLSKSVLRISVGTFLCWFKCVRIEIWSERCGVN